MIKRIGTGLAISAATSLAFALRVVPSWNAVFTPRGTSFQEPDAWFHMRSIHNLAVHFPWRSGFDPYMVLPSGKIATGNAAVAPLWDYVVASAAWMLGGGSPSDKLVDQMGAWLPAMIGAIFPVLVFFLARRLFGRLTGLLSAFWAAIIPGSFLWVSHLGVPDHHAIESLTSFLVLCLVAASVESRGKGQWWMAGLAGILLGAYLDVRPAGVFVPGILAVAALVEPALASSVVVTLGVAAVAFTAGSGSLWSGYTWLSLIGGIAAAGLSWWLRGVGARRSWPRRRLYGAIGVGMAATIACAAFFVPAKIHDLAGEISRFLPWHRGLTLVDEINELRPLWNSGPGGWAAVFDMFGLAWIFALGGLSVVAEAARRGRAALTLFAIWAVTMIVGVLFQARMGAYAGPVSAILAGTASAWLIERIPLPLVWLRIVAAGMLVAAGIASAIPFAIDETKATGGPDADWWSALDWLRVHTPEPLGDAQAWYRFWPALPPGQPFVYPDSAYGIMAHWDKGWWITGIAHRIPVANGQQDGIVETARFLTETEPEQALRDLQSAGARYAVVGPEAVTIALPALVLEGGRGIGEYARVYHALGDEGRDIPIRVYLPGFYRSMAARLYLFDGKRESSQGAQVYVTEMARTAKGVEQERFISAQTFPSRKDALAWMSAHPALRSTLASADATRSCIDTEGLPWARQVFASRAEQITGDRQPSVVKVFAFEQ